VFTSSLYRNLTVGFRHAGEHLLGEFVAVADRLGAPVPLTWLALAHVRVQDQSQGHDRVSAAPIHRSGQQQALLKV
jgi:hypothetical protein